MRNPTSIRASFSFRIALLYILFFLLSTLILFTFIYVNSTRSATEQLDLTLTADKTIFIERFQLSGLNGLIRLVNSRAQSQGQQAAYSLISQNKQILAGSLAKWPQFDTKLARANEHVEFQIKQHNEPANFRGVVIDFTQGFRLIVARSTSIISNAQSRLITTFLWAAIITLILGLLGGYMISKRAVRRIAKINRLCQTIIKGDISQRLQVAHAHDDLDYLSLNINTMLDKIEQLMGEIIHVSDSIAHDMRTPLSHLRLSLERLVKENPQNIQHEELINETDGIINTFNALLRISKIQARKHADQFKRINLADLCQDVAELYMPLLDEKKQRLHLQMLDVKILGDRDLLFQALANLLDNASKYTQTAGDISINLRQNNDRVTLQICDNGPGVNDDELKKLARRFYRVDASRTKPGNGLGLSLVKATAHVHQAQLSFQLNKPSGLCVKLIFNT